MYGKILVPVDGSETSILGLNEAIKIAKAQGSQLRLVHIVNELILDYTYSPGVYATNLIESLRKAGRTVLDVAETVAQRQGIKPECVLLESIGGREADFILAQAEEWQADLIVMGTHGRRGFLRVALGSDVPSAKPYPAAIFVCQSLKSLLPVLRSTAKSPARSPAALASSVSKCSSS
jgi:nucleotide-binding universal stress UspA family protein